METGPIADALVSLGCPADRAPEMAAQLDRRARQLAGTQGRTYEESLLHLLRMMAGGWAAQERTAGPSRLPTTLQEPPAPSPTMSESVKPWPTLASRPVGDFRIFTLRSDIKSSPRTGRTHDFYVIDCVDWVNVIALTSDGHLVMVEQFRHGTNTVELEIPGGMMDPHEGDPLATGIRELREETGYEGTNARLIGNVFPNAAIMSNRCHTLLVENCELKHTLELDHGEDLVTRLVPVDEVPRLVAAGHIRHAIAVAALFHFDLWRRGLCSRTGQ